MKFLYFIALSLIILSCRKDELIKKRSYLIGDYNIIKTRKGYSQGDIINEQDSLIITTNYVDGNNNSISADLGGYWGTKRFTVDSNGEVHLSYGTKDDWYKANITSFNFYYSERHGAPLGADITTTYSGPRIE